MELFLSLLVIALGLAVLGWWGLSWWKRRQEIERSMDMVFLKILIPKKDSEKDAQKEQANATFKDIVSVMEQFLRSLHSLEDRVMSFEYVVLGGEVYFYVVLSDELVDVVEKQITSYYPDAIIEQVEDYNIFTEGTIQQGAYMQLNKEFAYPFHTYQHLESDPLNNMTNSLSKIQEGEGAVIQIVVKPLKNGWQKECKELAESKFTGKEKKSKFNLMESVWKVLTFLTAQNKDDDKPNEPNRLTPMAEETVKAIEAKSYSIGFETVIRLVASADTAPRAKQILENMKNSFAQFNAPPELNSFEATKKHKNKEVITSFIFRFFKAGWRGTPVMTLSKEELASLYHFPHSRFNASPNIKWQTYKIAPPPKDIPKEGLLLGHNVYRGETKDILMNNMDRFRHFYVIGQTGTGKSSILKLMIKQDLEQGKGICVIDPHGDLINDVLPWVPRERADDVIVFNPADQERPLGLNLLEAETEEERDLIALDAMNIMIKLFGNEIFGPRIQDYFRNGCLTLMADPLGGCLTDIVRLFTDEEFQQSKVKHVTNPIVKSFWTKQMAQTGQREKAEMIPYFAAKFGQFVTNSMMRNIIGQSRSSFDFSEVMQNGKILLMNLSKGEMGDINSELLGMIIVSKLQMAAMRRQRIPQDQRRDFFLYIDEFQNYVTDSIESILSEARKYRLGLVLAHQYLDQLEKGGGHGGGVNLKGAIFGNVGTIMSYKIGATDGEYMAREFAPTFSEQDLTNLEAFKAVMKLSINNQPSKPFSINVVKPWLLPDGDKEAADAYMQLSRLKYGREKHFVEKEIFHRIGVTGDSDASGQTPAAPAAPMF